MSEQEPFADLWLPWLLFNGGLFASSERCQSLFDASFEAGIVQCRLDNGHRGRHFWESDERIAQWTNDAPGATPAKLS